MGFLENFNPTEPASKIIDAVSGFFGVLFEPTRIRRKAAADADATRLQAKADAEARRILADADADTAILKASVDGKATTILAEAESDATVIEAKGEDNALEIARRREVRVRGLEDRRQRNAEAITRKAIEYASTTDQSQSAYDKKPDEDWVHRFFDHCQDIGDEEMQTLWARLLAGEVSRPGSFSIRTLSIVREMSKADAMRFRDFCTFTVIGPQGTILPLVGLQRAGRNLDPLSIDDLAHLEYMNLIVFNSTTSAVPLGYGNSLPLNYFDRPISIFAPKMMVMHVGTCQLTEAGKQLFALADPAPNYEFIARVVQYWSGTGLTVTAPTDIVAMTDIPIHPYPSR